MEAMIQFVKIQKLKRIIIQVRMIMRPPKPQNIDQLKKLTEKLKFLESKISTMKSLKKKQSASQRSTTKKKDKSLFQNKSALLNFEKEILHKEKKKILKKSYSDKNTLKMGKLSNGKINKNDKIVTPKSSNNIEGPTNSKKQQMFKQFLTQIPKQKKSKPCKINNQIQTEINKNLKDSVCDSLRKNIHFTQQYGSQRLYYIEHALKAMINATFHPIQDHILQSIQTLNFLQNVQKPTMKQLQPHYVSLPPSKYQYCIVLDLDQTLIHCNENLDDQPDVVLTIKFPTGEKIDAGVNIRPYAIQFLKQVSQFAQVIVFTASHQCYANVVLDYLDPHKKYISHRLYRQNCWHTSQGIYIKDLRVLGNRSLKNVLLVDNAAYSYFYQLENGIPIIPFYQDKNDKQLIYLLHYIKRIMNKHKNENKTLHKTNSQFFKLNHYGKFEDVDHLAKDLYQQTLAAFKNQLAMESF